MVYDLERTRTTRFEDTSILAAQLTKFADEDDTAESGDVAGGR